MRSMQNPAYQVMVVMERVPIQNRWASVVWRVAAVVPDEGRVGEPVREELADGLLRITYPGLELGIFRDEAEGYFLNLQSPEPSIFAVWRWNEDESEAIPSMVTLSYNEAARWMDSQEKVERVEMPIALYQTLSTWVAENYEPPRKKQRVRPASFSSKEGRYDSTMGKERS